MKAPHCPQVGSSLSVRSSANFSRIVVMLSVCCLAVILAPLARAQKQAKIEVVSPTATAKQQLVSTGGSVKIVYKVNDDDIDSIRFKIDAPPYDAASGSAEFKKEGSHTFTAKLFKGKNTIHLFGFNGSDAVKTASAEVIVFCNNECSGPGSPKEPGSSNEGGMGEAKPESNITLKSPSGDVTAEGAVSSLIFVTGGIKTLSISVFDSDGIRVDHQPSVAVTDAGGKLGIAAPRLKMNKGQNFVRIFDPAKPEEKANETLAAVTCSGCAKIEAPVAGEVAQLEQKGRVKITSPKSITYGDKKEVKIKVRFEKKDGENGDKSLVVEVTNNKKTPKTPAQTVTDAELGTDKEFPVKLGSGLNEVVVYEEGHRDSQRDVAKITCDGKCGNDADAKEISIVQPKIPGSATSLDLTDKSTQDAYVTVSKGSNIKRIQYDVINDGKPVLTSPPVVVNTTATGLSDDVTVPMTLKFLKGNNTIRVYDVDHPGGNNDASIVINCTGDNCATDFLVATIPTNSRFTRAIVGMEQAGASSAESKSSPFLDFFFTTPLKFSEGEILLKPDGTPVMENGKPKRAPRVPRFGAWTQLRFSATPQQTAAFGVLPSNFVNQVTDPTKVVDLVRSFDFLGGIEYRAFNADGWIWTLIPGVKQRTSLYFTFGGGAISPLAATKASAQIFKIPPAANPAGMPPTLEHPERAEFIRRFGDPKTATYVGFVPLERDRFFRQYYVGIRLKTHYCEDEECHVLKNRFPSIVDIGFGQNEAVTGGRLTAEIRDSANNIKRRRAWVGRVDAFFPLPIREANFLYLYGTALMKLGGGPVNITTPLFLDEAGGDIHIFDANVYIPPPNLQPTRQDRDYYKIGIGVNLTDLFNRNKPKP